MDRPPANRSTDPSHNPSAHLLKQRVVTAPGPARGGRRHGRHRVRGGVPAAHAGQHAEAAEGGRGGHGGAREGEALLPAGARHPSGGDTADGADEERPARGGGGGGGRDEEAAEAFAAAGAHHGGAGGEGREQEEKGGGVVGVASDAHAAGDRARRVAGWGAGGLLGCAGAVWGGGVGCQVSSRNNSTRRRCGRAVVGGLTCRSLLDRLETLGG